MLECMSVPTIDWKVKEDTAEVRSKRRGGQAIELGLILTASDI